MSLEQLDAFLAFARTASDLQARLQEPLDLEACLALARGAGYALTEDDVIAAQVRQEATLSDTELQERAGVEARKLRNFINA
jgi:predicted ribosomally synthesized peptide with nif11-like leader